MLEAALYGESGGGEDHGWDLIEDEIAKKLGDVDGSGLQKGTTSTNAWGSPLDGGCARGGAALEPEDHVGRSRLEHEFEIGAKGGDAIFEARSFVEIGDAIELGFHEGERGSDGEVEVAGGFEELFAIGKGVAAIGRHGECGEEQTRALAKLLGQRGDLRDAGVAAGENVGVAGEVFEAEVRERATKVLRGHLFKLVRLVKDDSRGFWENASVGRIAGGEADGRVGKEQVVIDDDEVGLESATAHLGDEAAAIIGAGAAEAGVGACVEFVPESRGFGQGGKLGTVAGFSDALPLGNLAIFVDFVHARENGLVAESEELAATEIVGAALHVADAQLAEKSFEKRDVAEEELILEGLGSGGDDDTLAGAECGQKLGEGFAGARASLDDEMAPLSESALDGFGHFVLPGAVLEWKW